MTYEELKKKALSQRSGSSSGSSASAKKTKNTASSGSDLYNKLKKEALAAKEAEEEYKASSQGKMDALISAFLEPTGPGKNMTAAEAKKTIENLNQAMKSKNSSSGKLTLPGQSGTKGKSSGSTGIKIGSGVASEEDVQTGGIKQVTGTGSNRFRQWLDSAGSYLGNVAGAAGAGWASGMTSTAATMAETTNPTAGNEITSTMNSAYQSAADQYQTIIDNYNNGVGNITQEDAEWAAEMLQNIQPYLSATDATQIDNAWEGTKVGARNAAAGLQSQADEMTANALEGKGTVGSILTKAGIAGLQMMMDRATGALAGNLLGGGKAIQAANKASMLTRSFGYGVQEALDQGADINRAVSQGVITAAIEGASEALFGGNPVYDEGVGLVTKLASKVFGPTSKTVQVLMSTPFEILSEGLEEVIGDVVQPVATRIGNLIDSGADLNAEMPGLEELMEDMVVGSLLGGAGQVVEAGVNSARTAYADMQAGKTVSKAGAEETLKTTAEAAGVNANTDTNRQTGRTLRVTSDALVEDAIGEQLSARGVNATAETNSAIRKMGRGEGLNTAEWNAIRAAGQDALDLVQQVDEYRQGKITGDNLWLVGAELNAESFGDAGSEEDYDIRPETAQAEEAQVLEEEEREPAEEAQVIEEETVSEEAEQAPAEDASAGAEDGEQAEQANYKTDRRIYTEEGETATQVMNRTMAQVSTEAQGLQGQELLNYMDSKTAQLRQSAANTSGPAAEGIQAAAANLETIANRMRDSLAGGAYNNNTAASGNIDTEVSYNGRNENAGGHGLRSNLDDGGTAAEVRNEYGRGSGSGRGTDAAAYRADVSARELIGAKGSETVNLRRVTREEMTADEVQAERETSDIEAEVVFVEGKISLANGEKVDGVHVRGRIVVSRSSRLYSAKQLTRHEAQHQRFQNNPASFRAAKKELLSRLTHDQFMQILTRYAEKYRDMYKIPKAGASTEEYNAVMDKYIEEILCDIEAGMVRPGVSARVILGNADIMEKYGRPRTEATETVAQASEGAGSGGMPGRTLPAGVQRGTGKLQLPGEERFSVEEDEKETDRLSLPGSVRSIRPGMSEEQREEILREKTVGVPLYRGEADITVEEIKGKHLGEVNALIRSLAENCGTFGIDLQNRDAEISFKVSKTGIKESISKQAERKESIALLAELVTVLPEVCDGAVEIESHKDKYKGTRRAGEGLKEMHVLFGAFNSGEYTIPVQLEVKEFVDGKTGNKLYLMVTTGIKKPGIVTRTNTSNYEEKYRITPGYEVSIQEIVDAVNPETGGGLLRYIPDGMLDEEQIRSKRAEQEKDDARTADMRYDFAVKSGNLDDALEMLRRKAAEAGYSADDSWRMSHRAPNSTDEISSSIADEQGMKNLFGGDDSIYSDKAVRYYGEGRPYEQKTVEILKRARNNPDLPVKVYRAVRNTVKENRVRNGDWVALAREYAVEHGTREFGEDGYRIIENTVRAGDVYNNADSINEYGYDNGNDAEVYSNTGNNVKLLEPTYDDSGKLIPLSQRYNAEEEDTRYSAEEGAELSEEEQKEISSQLAYAAENAWNESVNRQGMTLPTAAEKNARDEMGEELYRKAKDGEALDEEEELRFSTCEDEALGEAAKKKNKTIPINVMSNALRQRAEIAEYFLDPENADKLNLPEDVKGNTTFGNSSYGVSVENTTVCERSLVANAFMDYVGQMLGRPLTVEETLYASQDLMQYTGIMTECLYCYVAMDRRAYREFLLRYLEERDAYLGNLRSGKDAEGAYKEFLGKRADSDNMKFRRQLIEGLAESGKELDASEFASIDDLIKKKEGLERKLADAAGGNAKATIVKDEIRQGKKVIGRLSEMAKGELAEDVGTYIQLRDAMEYAQSASWAKKIEKYRAYDGSILRWTAKRVKELNEHYGMRMYSFSDASAAFVLEDMQKFTDAAVRGLKVLAYTKRIEWARIFAPTGANINISVYCMSEEGNGRIQEDAMIGAPWDEAIELRKQYPNVGITMITTNDEQTAWALEQDWIDVVIPFHMVRTGNTVAEHFGFQNRTGESADTKGENFQGEQKSVFPAEHNNDLIRYAEILMERGLEPRFSRWLNGWEEYKAGTMKAEEFRAKNPNYMKLVNEVRRSAEESVAVQPVFKQDAAWAYIHQMEERGGYKEPLHLTNELLSGIAEETAENIREGKVSKYQNDAKVIRRTNTAAQNRFNEARPEMAMEVHASVEEEWTPVDEMSLKEIRSELKEDRDSIKFYDKLEGRGQLTEEMAADRERLRQRIIELSEARKPMAQAEAETRQKAVEAKAARNRPYRAKQMLKQEAMELFHTPDGRKAEMSAMIEKFVDYTMQVGKITPAARQRFFDRFYDAGMVIMEAEGAPTQLRQDMKGTRIYVPAQIRNEFGDKESWNEFRRKAFGAGIYLTGDVTDRGVDSVHKELAENYPGVVDGSLNYSKEMLEDVVEAISAGRAEQVSLDEMLRQNEDQGASYEEQLWHMEEQCNALLDKFAAVAKVETEDRAKHELQMAAEAAERKAKLQRERDAKNLRELQQKTLKSLQWLKKNELKAPEDLRAQFEDVLADIDLYAVGAANEMRMGDASGKTWRDLADMYKWAKDHDPNFLPSAELERIVTRLDAKKIADLDVGALEDLYRMANQLRTEFYNRNNLINDEMHRTFEELYDNATEEIKNSGGRGSLGSGKGADGAARFFNAEMMTPMNVMEMMGGWQKDGQWFSMAKSLQTGERNMKKYMADAKAQLQNFIDEHEGWIKTADGQGKDAVWYEYEVPELLELNMGDKPLFGNTVKIYMTPAQKVQMALEADNVQNLAHMVGGRTFVNKELYEQGKRNEALAQGVTVKMAPESVKALVKDLTTEERELYQVLKNYYNAFASERINKVSNALYGFDKAVTKDYAPIFTNRNYNKSEVGVFDVTAEGVGHMKGRVQMSKNPSYNISAFDAFDRHVDQTAKFVGLSIPIRNMQQLINWRTKDDSMKDTIAHAWGEEGVNYVEDMMTRMQTVTAEDKSWVERIAGKALNNYITAVFGANPGIVFKQFASFPAAAAVLDFRNMPSISQMRSVSDELIRTYTSELDYRALGYGTPELAALKNNPNWTQTNKFYKFALGGGAIQWMDVGTVRKLWPWAENYVARNFPELELGSEEDVAEGRSPFYRKVAEVFNDATNTTQPMYDSMNRAKIMGNSSQVVRALTMFKTVPLQEYNTLRRYAGEYRKATGKDKKRTGRLLGQALTSVLVSTLMLETIDGLADLIKNQLKYYRDDDDELTAGSILKKLGEDSMESLMGITLVGPVVWEMTKTVLSWFGVGESESSYDDSTLEAPGVEQINDLVSGFKDVGGSVLGFIKGMWNVGANGGDVGEYMKRNAGTMIGAAKEMAQTAATYFAGIPLENLEKYMVGLVGLVSPEAKEHWENMTDATMTKTKIGSVTDITDYFAARGIETEDTTDAELFRLYDAGNKKAVPTDTTDSVTVDGSEIVLTEAAQQVFDNAYTKALNDGLDDVVESDAYLDAEDAMKAKMLDRMYEYAKQSALREAVPEYDGDAWTAKAAEAVAEGVPEWAICELQAEKSEMKSEEILEYISDLELTKDQKGRLYLTTLTDSQAAKYDIASDYGISEGEYYGVKLEMLDWMDWDPEGSKDSLSGAECEAMLDTMSLSTNKKAAIWQINSTTSKAEKNPYSETVGQKVLDAYAEWKAEEEEPEEEEETGKLTLPK